MEVVEMSESESEYESNESEGTATEPCHDVNTPTCSQPLPFPLGFIQRYTGSNHHLRYNVESPQVKVN